jgi:hypothetical protein
MEALIRYSKEESEFFGLKIGRANCSTFETDAFKDSIKRNNFDVIRIRVDVNNTSVISNVETLPFQVYHHGSIVKYQLPVKGLTYSAYLNPEVTHRVYSGIDPENVARIIVNGSAKHPIGYWSTPGLGKQVSREDEVKYLSEYYSKLYVTPQRQLWFMEWEGVPVGFVASNFENGVMDTPLAAVLPDFRGKKLLHEIMISRNNYGVNHGISMITNGARKENLATQHVFSKFGMRTVGEDHVYHILCKQGKAVR